jgi:2-iminobutanoate/2-iminopropanoate deaminase
MKSVGSQGHWLLVSQATLIGELELVMARSNQPTRRKFLGQSGCVALTAGALGGMQISEAAVDQQSGTGPASPKRQVVPGSPSPAYSRAVRFDRLVFVAGCVGTRTEDGKTRIDADFRAQAEQTLRNLVDSVNAAGSTPKQVLKCTCFLKEYADFKVFNEVYMKVFDQAPPARSTVIVKDFVVPGALLEVDCVCCAE